MPVVEEVCTITAKGQTTVPKAVRQALGVGYGGRIAFRVEKETVTVHALPEEGQHRSGAGAVPGLAGGGYGSAADWTPCAHSPRPWSTGWTRWWTRKGRPIRTPRLRAR